MKYFRHEILIHQFIYFYMDKKHVTIHHRYCHVTAFAVRDRARFTEIRTGYPNHCRF